MPAKDFRQVKCIMAILKSYPDKILLRRRNYLSDIVNKELFIPLFIWQNPTSTQCFRFCRMKLLQQDEIRDGTRDHHSYT